MAIEENPFGKVDGYGSTVLEEDVHVLFLCGIGLGLAEGLLRQTPGIRYPSLEKGIPLCARSLEKGIPLYVRAVTTCRFSVFLMSPGGAKSYSRIPNLVEEV
jgi:hypothetical protein